MFLKSRNGPGKKKLPDQMTRKFQYMAMCRMLAVQRVDDGLECFRVIHGQVGQGFPVEGYVLFSEFSDENGIGHAVLPDTGVDAGDPQSPEIPLLGAAVPVSVG